MSRKYPKFNSEMTAQFVNRLREMDYTISQDHYTVSFTFAKSAKRQPILYDDNSYVDFLRAYGTGATVSYNFLKDVLPLPSNDPNEIDVNKIAGDLLDKYQELLDVLDTFGSKFLY